MLFKHYALSFATVSSAYKQGPSRTRWYGSWINNYLCNRCISLLMLWVRISIRARCTTLRDEVCQWLATGRWFSPGPPLSSTNKTDYHDIIKIMLKVALNTINQILKPNLPINHKINIPTIRNTLMHTCLLTHRLVNSWQSTH